MTTPPPKSGSGLSPNMAATLAYLFGAISGVLMLVVEKDDRFVRFHAMQSTVTFLAVVVAHLVLMGLPVIGWLLYIPFLIGVIGIWVLLMVKAFTGHKYKLPYIGDFADEQLK